MAKTEKKKSTVKQRREWAIEAKRNMNPYEEKMYAALLIAFEPWDVQISAQEEIGMYRADFIIYPDRIVVEVDGRGHDEPRQVYGDKRRESFMKNRGIRTIRFTTHEVYQDAAKCAQEVVKNCDRLKSKTEGGVKVTYCPPGMSGHLKQKKHFFRWKRGLT